MTTRATTTSAALQTQLATVTPQVFGLQGWRTHCEPSTTRSRHAPGTSAPSPPDGAGRLSSVRGTFLLPAEDSEVLLTALAPLARKDGDSDTRTAGQRRADGLTTISEQVLRHGTLPDAGGLRPQLSYVLPAGWAAAQHQHAACTPAVPAARIIRPLCAAKSGYGVLVVENAGIHAGDLPGQVERPGTQRGALSALRPRDACPSPWLPRVRPTVSG
jgi:hypothetical protein